ncbi:hypothetical protein [Rickettsia australis]|nr:hypothetical protein [Rickettsia australis]
MHIEVSSINVYNYDLIVDNAEEESEYIAAKSRDSKFNSRKEI